ncbi:unnamed protein product [Rodentolepis nana]|uniref:Ras-related protein Rab-10 n=1 Tax=Rodentolepis nana TaxID=102285 RepID=A0A0R3T8X9_RODNA|nr:unnamed protein product [Rodentolepis nana]
MCQNHFLHPTISLFHQHHLIPFQLSKKYEAEYLVKLKRKEIETEQYRETVRELKQQVQTNSRRLSTIVSNRSGNVTPADENAFKRISWRNIKQDSAEEEQTDAEKELRRESEELRKSLKEAQKHLMESEAELTQLRTIVETQSSQLHIEKLRTSTVVEEKDLLYTQIQKLKEALRDVQGRHAYLQGDFHEKAPDLHMPPWQRDSGQWSGSNSDRPNLDPEMASVTNWSNFDGLQAPDRIFRVVMVGESSVGKTCFMYRFCTGEFYYNARATVGVDFKMKNMTIDGNVYTIEIWDTAGQEKYHSLARQYFRKCDGAILMYDVSNRSSFNGVREWVNMLEEGCGDAYLPRMLVGNKTDLRDGPSNSMKPTSSAFISTKEGEDLAKVYDAEFMETSVLNSINVDEVIVHLASKWIDVEILAQLKTKMAIYSSFPRAMKYRGDCVNSGIKIGKKKQKNFNNCC